MLTTEALLALAEQNTLRLSDAAFLKHVYNVAKTAGEKRQNGVGDFAGARKLDDELRRLQDEARARGEDIVGKAIKAEKEGREAALKAYIGESENAATGQFLADMNAEITKLDRQMGGREFRDAWNDAVELLGFHGTKSHRDIGSADPNVQAVARAMIDVCHKHGVKTTKFVAGAMDATYPDGPFANGSQLKGESLGAAGRAALLGEATPRLPQHVVDAAYAADRQPSGGGDESAARRNRDLVNNRLNALEKLLKPLGFSREDGPSEDDDGVEAVLDIYGDARGAYSKFEKLVYQEFAVGHYSSRPQPWETVPDDGPSESWKSRYEPRNLRKVFDAIRGFMGEALDEARRDPPGIVTPTRLVAAIQKIADNYSDDHGGYIDAEKIMDKVGKLLKARPSGRLTDREAMTLTAGNYHGVLYAMQMRGWAPGLEDESLSESARAALTGGL